jgi:hypothetical protein
MINSQSLERKSDNLKASEKEIDAIKDELRDYSQKTGRKPGKNC